MKLEFENHHREDEVVMLNITPDVAHWTNSLEHIKAELDFYRDLLRSGIVEDLKKNKQDADFLLNQIELLNEENGFQRHTLLKYQTKIEGVKECEDVVCENHYLQDHLLLKKVLEKHFGEFQSLKYKIREFLYNGFKKYLA